jgi:cyanate permease
MLATRTRPSIRIERPWPGVWLYYGVLGFNLLLTAWIGEWPLLLSGVALHAVLAVALLVTARHSTSPPRASSATAPRSSAGFARAADAGGRQGGARREARDDRRKGGEAPLRG